MTFKEAAKKVLSEAQKPLSYVELTKRAVASGLLGETGKTPARTMNAQLATDIKQKGILSDFAKVGPGFFGLNPQKDEIESAVKPDQIIREVEQEEVLEVEGGFTGRAGEYAVISELLFRGFNAGLMGVDLGIDVIAFKDSKTFLIQVKTRNISERHKAFFFNLRIASYERNHSGNTFYIFILREKERMEYLILPFHALEKTIKEEFANVVGGGKLYRLAIKRRQGKTYIGRKENEVSYYLNNWNVLI